VVTSCVRMMKTLLLFSCLAFGVLSLSTAHTAGAIEDTPFGQTISNQQLFADLPFTAVADALYDPNGFCYVALTSNADTPLWSSKKRIDFDGAVPAAGENIFSNWRAVHSGDEESNILPSEESFLKLVKAPDSILLISSSSVVEIVLDFNCTTLLSVRPLTHQSSPSFGEILSATYADVSSAPEEEEEGVPRSSLWLGTTEGLFWLAPLMGTEDTDTVEDTDTITETTEHSSSRWSAVQIHDIDEPVSSLLWVQRWGRLFAGTSKALYELQLQEGFYEHVQHLYRRNTKQKQQPPFSIGQDTSLYQLHYQWIGGNLDFEVEGLSYDSAIDCVWAVQQEALHQRRSDGTWWRQGHYQGLISNNITTVAVTQQSFGAPSSASARASGGGVEPHFVWVGTKSKGVMRRQVRQEVEERGNEDTWQEDPWQQWLLFYGARYLPDGEVRMLVSDDNTDHARPAPRKQSSVLVVTASGVSVLRTQEWRLAEKEGVMQSYQYPRHDRHGIVAEVSLPLPGDTSQWSHACEGVYCSYVTPGMLCMLCAARIYYSVCGKVDSNEVFFVSLFWF
jgi:hypothetical protein